MVYSECECVGIFEMSKDFSEGRDLAVEDVLARKYYMFNRSTPLDISGDFEVVNKDSGLPWVCLTPMTRVISGSVLVPNAYGKYELRLSLTDEDFCKTLNDIQRELLYEMWDQKQSADEEEEVSWAMYYRDANKCLVDNVLKTSCRDVTSYGQKVFVGLYDRFGTEHTGTMDVDKDSEVQVHIQLRGYSMDNGVYGVCCPLHRCGVLMHSRNAPIVRKSANRFQTFLQDKRVMDITGHPLVTTQQPLPNLEMHYGPLRYESTQNGFNVFTCS